jgi:uncharacterized protein (DUF2147 family)
MTFKPMIAAMAVLLSAPAFAVVAEPVTGRWITEGGSAIVAIRPCGQQLCGTVERVLKAPANAPTTDVNNPDPALRKRPLVGVPILSGFTDAGKDWRGTIYDPKSGKSYRSILKSDGNALSVKGCIAVFCQSQRWTRAS